MTEHRHLITGRPHEIAAILGLARDRGDLVYAGRPVVHPDGRVTVETIVRQRQAIRAAQKPVRGRWQRPQVIGAVAVVCMLLTLLGIAAWLVIAAVQWVIAHIVAVVAIVCVVLVLIGHGINRCTGLHCGGCRG